MKTGQNIDVVCIVNTERTVMTDLREIAIHVNNGNCLVHRDDLATLLNAVVELETEIQTLMCAHYHDACEHRQTDKHKVEALDELNLKDVWPGKEKANG